MIGIFFGSTTGTTEELAGKIAERLNVAASDVHNVGETQADAVAPYDVLLLGTSTWGDGELQDDWYDFLDALKKQDLSGKKVGLFGCGDSESYPDTFCDGVGLIYEALASTGCTFVGAYTPWGYSVTDSKISKDGNSSVLLSMSAMKALRPKNASINGFPPLKSTVLYEHG